MRVIDSHTEGEPTRVIVDGGSGLGAGSLRERLERFRDRSDSYRRFAIGEPCGSDAVVGALLCEPDIAGIPIDSSNIITSQIESFSSFSRCSKV